MIITDGMCIHNAISFDILTLSHNAQSRSCMRSISEDFIKNRRVMYEWIYTW